MKKIQILLFASGLFASGLPASTAFADTKTTTAQDAQKLEMQTEARQVAAELVTKLGKALKQALSDSGPDGAISVCRDFAPTLAHSLSRRTGWKVGRVSLKVRNPLIGEPDTWEQGVLQHFDRAASSGADPETLQVAEIVSEPQGKYFRFMKALPVKPICLTCHGSELHIPASVRSKLAQDYPNDNGTGYDLMQVRGAVTIKRRLESTQ